MFEPIGEPARRVFEKLAGRDTFTILFKNNLVEPNNIKCDAETGIIIDGMGPLNGVAKIDINELGRSRLLTYYYKGKVENFRSHVDKVFLNQDLYRQWN